MSELDHYVVFGNPVEHSQSPRIHALFAEQTNDPIRYEKLFVPLGEFKKSVMKFIDAGGRGANVTVPFKVDAFEFATTHSQRAQSARAVNTLTFRDGQIFADNTDGVGLVNDITRNLGFSVTGKSVLVVGSGGATRGVLLPIVQERPREIVVINRTAAKANELVKALAQQAESHSVRIDSGGLDAVGEASFDLVVNATSSSLTDDAFPVSTKVLANGALAYDMMYGKQETSFTRWAEMANAARVSDGLGMLVEQAAESCLLLRGKRPDAKGVIEALRGK
jgi:shikimate dehydrogenase